MARKRGWQLGRAGGQRYSLRASPGADTIAWLTQVIRHRQIPDTRMTFAPPGLDILPRVKFRADNGTTPREDEDLLTRDAQRS